jgi:hypothetical protein
MRHRRRTSSSFSGWLSKIMLLCLCITLAAKPVAAFAMMMHAGCTPASASDSGHDPHHHEPAHAAEGMSGHDHDANRTGTPDHRPHAASPSACCSMLCAAAMLPGHIAAPVASALFSSALAEPGQIRPDGWSGRLFRPPRRA